MIHVHVDTMHKMLKYQECRNIVTFNSMKEMQGKVHIFLALSINTK